MFTGIVQQIGVIKSWNQDSRFLEIKSDYKDLILGESISCSGVCLTVSKIVKNLFYCNLSNETIQKTNFKKKNNGDKLNLERSLKIGDDLSGHLVFGHVDGICILKEINNDKDSWILKFEAQKILLKYLTQKCSISIDGISLTVNEVGKDSFKISIIPFTWKHTNLQFAKLGDSFNVEIDMLARYVFRALNK